MKKWLYDVIENLDYRQRELLQHKNFLLFSGYGDDITYLLSVMELGIVNWQKSIVEWILKRSK